MGNELLIYNTYTRNKEIFKPINPPHVGMYVCGPTVYGDAHLGHARPSITFDLIYRYLKHLNYKVRYVRNITDVGHLENDADDGEDKISKKARIEQLEPMEIAHYYTTKYHDAMQQLNVLTPSIEPHASGHIIEQISMIERILKNGFAYISNGSVYFDVEKYNKHHNYGKLSGRKIEDLISNTRVLDGQDEKNSQLDFALWKKAQPEHIMRWTSPWSVGFPGWHLECSAMSAKYLGEKFDIHGGGMDLMFPHHEAEIAQCVVANNSQPANYWIHNNMITINGKKMGKSLGNFITLEQFFTGNYESLEQAYSPMTVRFFILQAHYGSTLDFSNEALKAAEKGLERLLKAYENISKIENSNNSTINIESFKQKCYEAMNDDFNSPIVIANLFEIVKIINLANSGSESLNKQDIELLKEIFDIFLFEILGLKTYENNNNDKVEELMQLIIELRHKAKENKDWTTSDNIRDKLQNIGISIKDTKDGAKWEIK